MATPEKESVVRELAELLQDSPAIYLADFTGLNVEAIGILRRKCRKNAIQFRVVKNRLAKRAVEGTGFENLLPYLTGPTAIATCAGDPATPARVLKEFVDEYERPAIKVGLIEGRLLDSEQVWGIAKLPSREILLGQFVGGLQSPLRNLIWAMKGVGQGLVRALAAIQEQKAAQAGGQG